MVQMVAAVCIPAVFNYSIVTWKYFCRENGASNQINVIKFPSNIDSILNTVMHNIGGRIHAIHKALCSGT